MLRNICSLLQPHIPSKLPSHEKPAQKICNLTLQCLSRPSGMAETGRIRTVAISHKERLDILADVSTVKEISKSICYGLWGPRGVPKEVMNKLLRSTKQP
jgi:tripartite-type tricarboxylate transporter receptor subunit TctC